MAGSGKSTLLRCLNLLETPTSGQIFFKGEEITGNHHDINKFREQVGMVFQHFNLFPHKTVLQNIMLAPVYLRIKKAGGLFARPAVKKQIRSLSALAIPKGAGLLSPVESQ